MAYDFSNLPAFTQEVTKDIIIKTYLAGKTTSKATAYEGIKLGSTQNINYLDMVTNVVPFACEPTYTGNDTFSVRPLYVAPLMIAKKWCPGELDKYWAGQLRKSGTPEDMPFIDGMINKITSDVANYNECSLWQGILGSTATSYNQFDGYFKILGATSVSPVGVTAAAGPHTALDVVAHVDAMVAAIPTDILANTDLTLFVSLPTYMLYTAAMRKAYGTLILDPALANGNFEMTIPGTNVTIVGIVGFGTSTKMVLMPWSNLAYGCDLQGDAEKLNLFYDQITMNNYANGVYGLGAQILIPEYAVINF